MQAQAKEWKIFPFSCACVFFRTAHALLIAQVQTQELGRTAATLRLRASHCTCACGVEETSRWLP